MQTVEAEADGFEDPARWYRQHYALVWDTARRYGIAADAREDVVQETFLTAYRRRASLGTASMRAWLYGIARRVAANHRRKAFRYRRKRDRLAWESLDRSHLGSDTAVAAATLDNFLATLKPADRELFVLSEIEGFTGPEIANAMGRNLNTTYSRIRENRQRFTEVCAEPIDAVASHRKSRPPASAASWALLMPRLEGGAAAASTITWNLGGLLAGMAASGAVVLTLVAATDPQPDDGPASTPSAHAPRSASAADEAGERSPQPAAVRGDGQVDAPALAGDGAWETSAPVTAAAAAAAPAKVPALNVRPGQTRAPGPPRAGGDRSVSRAASAVAEADRAAEPKVPVAAKAPLAAVPQDTEDGALLRKAMQGVHADPAGALSLVERHENRFPQSAFSDVRAVIKVKALCGLGKPGAAKDLAGRFLAKHPGSPMSKQLRRGCKAKS